MDGKLAERVLRAVNQDEAIALLQALVRDSASVNPPGDVRESVRICQEKLAAEGFETKSIGDTEIVPNLVETDFGYHIIKLEAKNAASSDATKETEAPAPGAPPSDGGATYNARHILISTGVKDPENPMGREEPVKRFVTRKLE